MLEVNEKYFKKTFNLALKGKGLVSPNPLVGAVVVKNNKIIATGFHQGAGTDHAERMALKSITPQMAKGADIYINLEPCSHFGKTPPCTDIIIEYGLKRVFYALNDINKEARNGHKILKNAGLEVYSGFLKEEAFEINKFFFKWQKTKKPYVILKTALSLDGKVATSGGESQWISGEESRSFVHGLRGDVDAVLVASGTALKDNPKLSARPMEKYKQPKRILLDSSLKVPINFNLYDSNVGGETIVFCGQGASPQKEKELLTKGVKVYKSPKKRYPLTEVLATLGNLGVQSLLVEPGGFLAEEFLLKNNLVDLLHMFIAPKLIGGALAPGFLNGEGLKELKEAPELEFLKISPSGKDLHLILRPANGFSLKDLDN